MARGRITSAYGRASSAAGGRWHAYVTVAGGLDVVVDHDADRVVSGYSVQKVAVAVAVLDRVDRGELALDRRLRLTPDLVLGGSGSYHLQPVWGDELTIANVLTALLLVSDNTAVRLCGLVVPAHEVNEILAAKGFVHTRVEPVAHPRRFLLGTTTPRETHDLLWRLATGTLLSDASTDFLLRVLRAPAGYHDGVRRDLSSTERARVATKHAAEVDETGAARHEAGVVFGTDGAPRLAYALFADGLGDRHDYGGTHPAVRAHAAVGRAMLDALP